LAVPQCGSGQPENSGRGFRGSSSPEAKEVWGVGTGEVTVPLPCHTDYLSSVGSRVVSLI